MKNEMYIPTGNLEGSYEVLSCCCDCDLSIVVVSTKDSNKNITIVFPDIIAYRVTSESFRLKDLGDSVLSPTDSIYEVKNSQYLIWLSECTYSQIHHGLKDLRHLLVYTENYVYDIIVHVGNENPYYIEDNIKKYI